MKKEIVSKFISYVENGSMFLSDKLPDLFRGILRYSSCYDVILIFIFVLVIIFLIYAIKKLSADFVKDENAGTAVLWLGILFLNIFTVIAVLYLAFDLLKIFIAPKMYLVDYFMGKL